MYQKGSLPRNADLGTDPRRRELVDGAPEALIDDLNHTPTRAVDLLLT